MYSQKQCKYLHTIASLMNLIQKKEHGNSQWWQKTNSISRPVAHRILFKILLMNTLTTQNISRNEHRYFPKNILNHIHKIVLSVTLVCGLSWCGEDPKMYNTREVQTLLRKVWAYHGEIDGNFGSHSTKAIILVQSYCMNDWKSLIIGKNTQPVHDVLIAMVHAGKTIQNCPEYTDTLPEIIIEKLSNQTDIIHNGQNIQKMLTFMRAFRWKIDGIIGNETLQWVARYQAYCHPDSTEIGILDQKTLFLLTEDIKNGKNIYNCQQQ